MQLQRIKMIACAVWVLAVFAIAMAVDLSGVGVAAAAALAFLPPLALLLLWNEPTQTMSEIINKARR
jgi:Na+/proline symporter